MRTDLLRAWGGAVVGMAFLVSCGGSDGVNVPITLQGATLWQQTGGSGAPVLRQIVGGTGDDFRGVIFVDDGVRQVLEEETGASGGTVVFGDSAASGALLTLPGTTGAADYESVRFLTLSYQLGPDLFTQSGYIGLRTPADDMARASGTATFTGTGTVDVRVFPITGNPLLFPGGNAAITADFSAGTVDIVMGSPGPGSPSRANWEQQAYDEFRVTGMTIDGSAFSGGTFLVLKNGTALPVFTSADFQSSGFFAGFNDGNGNVGAGDLPGEAAGAFVATSGVDGTATGLFAGD